MGRCGKLCTNLSGRNRHLIGLRSASRPGLNNSHDKALNAALGRPAGLGIFVKYSSGNLNIEHYGRGSCERFTFWYRPRGLESERNCC